MKRPVTILSGQWADLPLDVLCRKTASMGYDGIEIACWGDHMNIKKAASDPAYVEEKQIILSRQGLGCWALSAHLSGQCVGDRYDERLNTFVPGECKGNPEKIRAWALEEMMLVPQAAKNMGCSIVTCFMGSPIWGSWYSFPPTTQTMIDDAFKKMVDVWTPIFDAFDRCGVRFALEVHPAEIAFDYYTTQRLLSEFGHRDTLGLNFDPSHLLWQGVTPHVFLRDFAQKVYHVHMKDVALNPDGKAGVLGSHLPFGDLRRGWNFCSLGRGNIDFEKIIRELNTAQYEGPLSVEWEDSGMDREFGATEALGFVRRLDFKPSALAFDDAMRNE